MSSVSSVSYAQYTDNDTGDDTDRGTDIGARRNADRDTRRESWEEQSLDGSVDLRVRQRRLVIAVDYGTTFTGVSYATPEDDKCELDDIKHITYWGERMPNQDKVPSRISYSPRTGANEANWGSDMSPDAVTMIHTKLELDVRSPSDELASIIRALDGTQNLSFSYIKKHKGTEPAYSSQTAEEIVTDYLTHVFEYLIAEVNEFSETLRQRIATDIIFTVPTGWSRMAKNSTFRAITHAGFSRESFPELQNVIMVTEPEAAAIYSARYVKEARQQEFLKKVGECFILCDAGGGTVDVASYRATNLHPLEIELITEPTGEKCGSIYIDLEFKKWLREVLGPERYRQLDPHSNLDSIGSHTVEGKRMRKLMADFEVYKKEFHKGSRAKRLDLPSPHHRLTIPGTRQDGGKVQDGEITIPNPVMQKFFDVCVNDILELVSSQRRQIKRKNMQRRIRTVLLVGGFSESKYLQEELAYTLERQDIKVHRPDTSWPAIVKGAVVCGIEKSSLSNLSYATPCPRSFGISVYKRFEGFEDDYNEDVASNMEGDHIRDQMIWLIDEGDLILGNEPRHINYSVPVYSNGSGAGMFEIFAHEGEGRPSILEGSRDELEPYELLFKLSRPGTQRRRTIFGGRRQRAVIQLQMRLEAGGIFAQLKRNGNDISEPITIPLKSSIR